MTTNGTGKSYWDAACMFAFGAGVGVGLGMLLAPKKGGETRETIRQSAIDGKDYVVRRSKEFTDKATQLVDEGKSTVERHREGLKAAVEAGRQTYVDHLQGSRA